jgi:hypothetical protein
LTTRRCRGRRPALRRARAGSACGVRGTITCSGSDPWAFGLRSTVFGLQSSVYGLQ